MTTHRTLRAANLARQAEWDPGQQISLSYRGNELGGECGEAQNVIKKLERERLGIRGSRATLDDLAQELADVVICADLIAMAEGIDLDQAVADKFNATSEKVGLVTRLEMSRAGAAYEESTATCQACGGEIAGWLCQSCPAEFRENDDGALIFDWEATGEVADFLGMLRLFGPCTFNGRTITFEGLTAALLTQAPAREVTDADIRRAMLTMMDAENAKARPDDYFTKVAVERTNRLRANPDDPEWTHGYEVARRFLAALRPPQEGDRA